MSSESSAAKKSRAKAASDVPSVRTEAGGTHVLRWLDAAGLVAFLALTFLLGAFPLKDTDFWWHLKTGDWIRENGRVPTTDLFTFTVPDAPWIDLHWVFQVLLSWGYEHGGIVALNLSKCVITCAAVLLLVTARRREWPAWPMVLAWLPSILVLGGRMYVRPETMSLLYLAIELAILFRIDRTPNLAFALPFVQAAWVNTQGLFVLGPIVLAFALIDAALRPGSFAPSRREWWRKVGLASLLTGVACLFNPYGLAGALYPLELARTMRNPIFSKNIGELKPIPDFIEETAFDNLPLQLHLATMLLGALSFLLPICWLVWTRLAPKGDAPSRGAKAKAPAKGMASKSKKKSGGTKRAAEEPLWRLSPFRLLLFGAFSVLSFQATRNSHQFAAVVGTVTAWNFGEWAAAIARRNVPRFPAAPRLATLGAVLLVFALVASGTFYAMAGEGRTIGLGEEPLWFPHEAVAFAGTEGMPERYLGYHIGHASLYEYRNGPGRKVFADARLEVIGPDLFARYLNLKREIADDPASGMRQLDEMGRPVVLVDHIEGLTAGTALLAQPRWRCVWFDPVAALFVHDSYSRIVGEHAVDFAARHFRPEAAPKVRGPGDDRELAKAYRNYSPIMYARGRPDVARPMVLLGLDHARRLRRLDPGSADGWKERGLLMSYYDGISDPRAITPRPRLGYDPIFDLAAMTATYSLLRAHEAAPGDFLTLKALKDAYERRGMYEAALPRLDRLVALRPINPLQRQAQEEEAARRGQYLAELGAAPPSTWENQSELDQAVTSALASGRVASAVALLERAYPEATRPWPVTERLANLLLHLGEPARARGVLARAVSPPRPALRAARVALTYLVEDATEEARRGFREALAAEPGLFEAAYGLAVLEADAGRAAEALASARSAASNAPNDLSRSSAQALVALAAPYAEPASPRAGGREGAGPAAISR